MPYREPVNKGEVYHVFNRGVDKREIFLKNQDYLRFILALYILNDAENRYDIWTSLNFKKEATLSLLKSTIGTPGVPIVDTRLRFVELLAFTLMPNHYHLIIRVVADNGLSKFMHKFGIGYSKYFNQQNKRSGFLFEGPYKAVKVKTDDQLLILFNYVHTNPVELVEQGWKTTGVQNEARALKQQNMYPWTSYHDYIGNLKFPIVTDRDFYLELLNNSEGCRSSVEDWIKFKAETADIPEYLKKVL
ncbi:MAG: hypothetical protein A3F94_00580 [Candidatus Spechtbacteria bacterium RIFCSPLOWO2_12_FULL_38_22]|uniref:Transposase IS200-like domain-containing protein n=1 Tax=Candidatus Spechtbacteria bacterium RIFCSPLOWO2_12_FULL_38_22 TaxID=1802165 RepID=A0A1G2HG15_9BACT|nr:MAG: hypothetical protein A2728_02220 [Candidatus Spechtbacteria bacterium RIFCSPHIGHO2_01_FULL_38_11]OGZ59608.1 MAG: hypothetical protein A3E58_00195 [Candidatus Spechtbacteria bacterium RIFCSPHIGHO2_12_FULL_38_30]OGZ61435.1 MAG: hypothetical protein A3F94_00580 [Candidatus Spechtbacteria bacterium RIFCSPLOWO2_12_FULL_38_22]